MTDSVRLQEIATACGRRFGRATLDVPKALNALSLEMIDRLAPALERWQRDPAVVGVFLDGAGEKGFCAGGDVAALYRAIRAAAPRCVPPLVEQFFEREYRLDHRIHTFSKPVVCWGHGIVLGGGVGLLAGASHRIVTSTTRIAMPEIGIGLYPDVGASWFLHRMPGRIGLFLALTGAPLNAADARFVGLADFVVPATKKADVLTALGERRFTDDPDANAIELGQLLKAFPADIAPLAANLERHFDLIESVMRHESLGAIAEDLRSLTAHDDPWMAAAASAFAKGSPTSAALSYAMWQRTRGLTLGDVFRLEYVVSASCSVHHDFAEGVRALLIDKDRSPRWAPESLVEIDPSLIEDHFTPRFEGSHPLADLSP